MKSTKLVVVTMSATLLLGGGIASAATKAVPSVKACVDSKGVLSLLSKGKCAKGTHVLALSVIGKTGKTGKTGAPGTNGINGINGINGTNGTNGAAGPSDVYVWAGSLNVTTTATSTVTVPAGNYIVRWQGLMINSTVSATSVDCFLYLGNAGTAYPIALAAGQKFLNSYEVPIHAASSFTTKLDCTLASGVSVGNVVLTATATGALHGTGIINLP